MTVTNSGFNINSVGVILFVAGICSIVIGGAVFVAGSARHEITRESVQYTPNGSERLVEHRDLRVTVDLHGGGTAGPSPLVGLGPESGERDHIAYGFGAGEQHNQTVDPDTKAACRRQAVLERTQVIFVDRHCLVVPARTSFRLRFEILSLYRRVGQLREGITKFATRNHWFEALHEAW